MAKKRKVDASVADQIQIPPPLPSHPDVALPAPRPLRKREYRCRRINADSNIVCTRLLFIAALPDGVTIEIQCTKCGRIAHVTNEWPMPDAKPLKDVASV